MDETLKSRQQIMSYSYLQSPWPIGLGNIAVRFAITVRLILRKNIPQKNTKNSKNNTVYTVVALYSYIVTH